MTAHAHGRSDRRALATALALVVGFAVVEAVAGALSGSLALLADAGHMASDGLALALALGAAVLAQRPATPRRSFGWRRAEVLAALVNGVVLVLLALWIIVAALRRLADPPEVEGGWMLLVGALGLAVNMAAARVLHRAGDGLNVRAALLHVLADLASSVGVVLAGLVVLTTGWTLADPLAGLAIGVLVLLSTRRVLADAVGVLLESAPRGLDVDALAAELRAADGVVDVHDLHVWTITSGFPALSAHVLVEPRADCHAIRERLEALLRERFALTHTTLQVEHAQGLLQVTR